MTQRAPFDDQIQHVGRLQQIRTEEERLRAERSSILGRQPWYKRPGSTLGVIAIVVSIVLFALNILITQQRKELSISYTKPATLVFFTSSVKPKSKIVFDGKPIEDLWRSVLYIKNTGTRAIQLEDFKDGPLAFKIRTTNAFQTGARDTLRLPFLLDVVPKATAGQRQASISIKERSLPAAFDYLPTILNPDDLVEVEIYTSVPADYDLSLEGKILDGVVSPPLKLAEIPSSAPQITPRETIFRAFNQMLGAKWVTIGIFILWLLAGSYVSFGAYAFADENSWEIQYVFLFAISVFFDLLLMIALVFAVLT